MGYFSDIARFGLKPRYFFYSPAHAYSFRRVPPDESRRKEGKYRVDNMKYRLFSKVSGI